MIRTYEGNGQFSSPSRTDGITTSRYSKTTTGRPRECTSPLDCSVSLAPVFLESVLVRPASAQHDIIIIAHTRARKIEFVRGRVAHDNNDRAGRLINRKSPSTVPRRLFCFDILSLFPRRRFCHSRGVRVSGDTGPGDDTVDRRKTQYNYHAVLQYPLSADDYTRRVVPNTKSDNSKIIPPGVCHYDGHRLRRVAACAVVRVPIARGQRERRGVAERLRTATGPE